MPNRNTPLRFYWSHTHRPGYPRGYFAMVNPHLVLNAHRIREGSPTWEYLVVGFDITKQDHPTIVRHGTRGTLREAQLAAEAEVPPKTPAHEQAVIDFGEDQPWGSKEDGDAMPLPF